MHPPTVASPQCYHPTDATAAPRLGQFSRLARQPAFDGAVIAGADYVMIDDFVGMGGTLANLRGHIESHGGQVLAGGGRLDRQAAFGQIAALG